MSTTTRVLACLAAALPGLDAATFFASPSGSDANPGTESRPFATLARAQSAVRGAKAGGPVTVNLRGGTYYLPATWVLTAEDSGSANAPVVWQAWHDEVPVLSGGMKLVPQWEPHRDGILKTRVPAGFATDQLFVDGERQILARYPNFDPGIRMLGGYSKDAFSAERAARWADPRGGFIHAMHEHLWGDFHYRITGKDAAGKVTYEGGWQNNRRMGMHGEFRFVENVLEELDATREWFLDGKTSTLYYRPPDGLDLSKATFEGVRLRHLVEFRGTEARPAAFVEFRGIVFRHAARTFMDNKEPLLRSDWTTYRGGAVVFAGTEHCSLRDCTFDQPGGNAIFVDGYNRHVAIRGCEIAGAGANGIAFVGNPAAVRNPLFEYNRVQDLADIDRTPGPKSSDYPADCLVEDCLIHRGGRVEKQTAGVQIAMSRGITVRHCSIYDLPRAGINIGDGCWGGHTIEFCDVFDTVKETGDHGSFNSWGRDRHWRPNIAEVDAWVRKVPDLPLLDTVKPVVLRNNRWRCDHGWDIDLDDGSSNYEIRDNLCLNGGLKNREGFNRVVENNVIVGNSFHPHVWHAESRDVFRHNIVSGPYQPIGMRAPWGAECDHNLLHRAGATDETPASGLRGQSGRDDHSLVADARFVDPVRGDYRVRDGSPALKLGFRNFPMDRFGVLAPRLKAKARTPELPGQAKATATATAAVVRDGRVVEWLGGTIKNVVGPGEVSAAGLPGETGVSIVSCPAGSAMAKAGLRAGDVILKCAGTEIPDHAALLRALRATPRDGRFDLDVFRAQNHVPVALPAPAAGTAGTAAFFRTSTATFAIDATGALASVRSVPGDREFVAPRQPSPLLSLRIDGRFLAPKRATWDPGAGRLTLGYDGPPATVVLAATAKPTHVVFEVRDVQSSRPVELVLWGPYPTPIGDIIGETVGVVRDQDFAFGIQTLNAKTLGGYPNAENDVESGFGGDDHGNYADLPAELRKDQSYRTDTARTTSFGSQLQAFCRNRDHDRIIANWGHSRFLAPAYPDGGVTGSKIALFAAPAPKALETIGSIELAENLPHPLIDGVWGKQSAHATDSYLIVDFGEATIDRAIEMTRRAGLRYLYHSSPFETWGHFRLKPSLFPNGWAGMRACVEKARAAGVRLGVHTLSNFVTPGDAYVTPRPDRRLARIGVSTLAAAVSADQKDIPVRDLEFVRNPSTLNTVRIGDELVRFGSVAGGPPWVLRDCQRGAWGTKASPHAPDAGVDRLMDHGYNVFLGDADLSAEIARTIARFCNETGVRQLSFDGVEGNWASGMGQYGRTLFAAAWHDALSPELRGQVINDASLPGHFSWHVYTRMNWGEPWYAGFRESQTLYRFKNQLYYERNLMPRMLGWFALRPNTSIEDAEWLLARAAGYHAGFALAASLASTAQLDADPSSAEATRQFGASLDILGAIRHWETARMSGAFTPEVRAALRDNAREFHLEPAGAGAWNLRSASVESFAETPGAAASSGVAHGFANTNSPQRLRWVIRNAGSRPVAGLTVAIDGKPAMDLGGRPIPAGGSVRYSGGAEATVCDPSWKEIARVPVDAGAVTVGTGNHRVSASHAPEAGTGLRFELRTFGPSVPLHAAPTPGAMPR